MQGNCACMVHAQTFAGWVEIFREAWKEKAFQAKKQLSHDERTAKRGVGQRIQFKEMQREEMSLDR